AGVLQRVRKSLGQSSAKAGNQSRTRTKDEDGCVLSLAEWEKLDVVTGPLIVDCAAIDAAKVRPGKVSAACGRAGFIFIEQAIRAALAKKIEGVVTAPIHKEALRRSGVKHPG